MTDYKYFTSVLIALLVLTGCSKNIESNLPDYEQVLVLNSVFNPDSLFSVDLSTNRPISSNAPFAPIVNASVLLYRDGTYLTDLTHSKNGVYQASVMPESLKKYEIRVKAPGFDDISAHSTVPARPLISDIKISQFQPDGSAPATLMSFTLSDPPAEENFYSVQAYTFEKDFRGNIFQRPLSIKIISAIEEDYFRNGLLFFRDKLFNGKALDLKFNLSNVIPKNAYFRIAQVSPEYYLYGKTYDMHRQTDFNIGQHPVSNNIENGLGVFAGYNAVTIRP